jgi:acyl-CoA oxidase
LDRLPRLLRRAGLERTFLLKTLKLGHLRCFTFSAIPNFLPSHTHSTMPSNPSWVKALKPSGHQGSEILQQERSKSSLNVDQLADFMFTKEVLERNQRLLKILEAEQVFEKSQNYFLGRNERIQAALARGKRLRQLSVKHKWSQEDYQVANELISEPTPYGLHASMFLVSSR